MYVLTDLKQHNNKTQRCIYTHTVNPLHTSHSYPLAFHSCIYLYRQKLCCFVFTAKKHNTQVIANFQLVHRYLQCLWYWTWYTICIFLRELEPIYQYCCVVTDAGFSSASHWCWLVHSWVGQPSSWVHYESSDIGDIMTSVVFSFIKEFTRL